VAHLGDGGALEQPCEKIVTLIVAVEVHVLVDRTQLVGDHPIEKLDALLAHARQLQISRDGSDACIARRLQALKLAASQGQVWQRSCDRKKESIDIKQ
jgi:hypothetical protein